MTDHFRVVFYVKVLDRNPETADAVNLLIEVPLAEDTDEALEAARVTADKLLGPLGPLPVDPKHDFPNFIVYNGHEELGGG